ncbi:MAG: hypothetical protein LKE40_07680 [Spirochaetia bacterium]|jgi:transcriptional antiterminator NusG|nr:hypothetical protein [Spirochaetia bacterium]
MAYYCISSRVGAENKLIPHLQKEFERTFEDADDVEIVFPYKLIRERHGKVYVETKKPLLPGYILLRTEQELGYYARDIHQNPYCFGLVRNRVDNTFRMFGNDIAYAEWVYTYDGLIKPSKVTLELGSVVRVVSGPLVDCCGEVAKVDKRSKKIGITMDIIGAKRLVWLPVDILEVPVADKDVKRVFEK